MSKPSTSIPRLSEGALDLITESNDESLKPILQIVAAKIMDNNNKVRCVLFDGVKSFQHCMMIFDGAEDLYKRGLLKKFTVIQLEDFNVSSLKKKDGVPVILVKKIKIIMDGSKVDRKLSSNNEMENELFRELENNNNPQPQPQPSLNVSRTSNNNNNNRDNTPSKSGPSEPINLENICPINVLTPFYNAWVICGTVMSKSNIRHYNNRNGDGKLFSFDICDDTGEIRLTGFNKECDRFYDLIEKDKMYVISKGIIKPANKKYSPNEYEITLTQQSQIQLYNKAPKHPVQIRYKFVCLKDIINREAYSMVDVIGVIHNVGDLETITSKKNGKDLKKRDLDIVDESKYQIRLTLWDEDAVNFNGQPGQIIALKGASVNDFKGKTISARDTTVINLDPDVPETNKLRIFYQTLDSTVNFTPLSSTNSDAGSMGKGWSLTFVSFVDGQKMNQGETKFFTINAVLQGFGRSANHFYKSCGFNNCQKKVQDDNDNLYTCTKCNRTSPTFTWRVMLSLRLSDVSGTIWSTLFQNNAEKFFGRPVEEVAELFQNHRDKYNDLLDSLRFKEFQFRITSRLEEYNNEFRVKTSVNDVKEIKPANRAQELERIIAVLKAKATGSLD